jgi:hypothetical protein
MMLILENHILNTKSGQCEVLSFAGSSGPPKSKALDIQTDTEPPK